MLICMGKKYGHLVSIHKVIWIDNYPNARATYRRSGFIKEDLQQLTLYIKNTNLIPYVAERHGFVKLNKLPIWKLIEEFL